MTIHGRRPPRPRHACPGGCGRVISAALHACPDCWAVLPAEHRRTLIRHHVGSLEHAAAMGAARSWFTRQTAPVEVDA